MIGAIFVLLASISSGHNSASVADVYHQAEIVNASPTLTPAEKATVLSKIYRENFSDIGKKLSRLSTDDIRVLMRLTDMVNAYTRFQGAKSGGRNYIWEQYKDFQELARRGSVERGDVEGLYDQLIRERLFTTASELRTRYGESYLPSLPKITSHGKFNANLPALLRLASDGRSWVIENPDVKARSYQILVVAQCHIASKAAQEIAADPVLSGIFKNAIWLESSGEPLDETSIAQWNNSFPGQNLSIAYDNSRWPGVDFSLSPNFYILHNGSVVANMEGWSKVAGKRHLIDWLSSQGISIDR